LAINNPPCSAVSLR